MSASNRGYSLAPEIVVEKIGDDVIVMDSSSAEVRHVTGEAAAVVWSIANNIPLAKASNAVVRQLIDAGIVTSSSAVHRRTVLGMGAVGLGAAVTALSLPAVAAASSVITLSGIWAVYSSGRFLAVFDNPPATGPGPLSVPGGTATYEGTRSRSGVDYMYWEQNSATPQPNAPTVGTFTWEGLSYQVNFAYDLGTIAAIFD